MKCFVGLLLVATLALSLPAEESQSQRDKRQLLLLVNPPPRPVLFVPVIRVEQQTCGTPAVRCEGVGCESRMVGGTPTVQNEYPWVAQILLNGAHHCAGALVDNQFVLTAASCIEPATPKSVAALTVRLGEYKRDTMEDGPVMERNVSVAYTHSGYVAPSSMNVPKNDIALLRLGQPVTFTEKVMPICLDDGQVRVDSGFYEGIVSGWGRSSYSNRVSPMVLHKANVKINTPQECQNAYAYYDQKVSDDQICAGVNGQDACVTDNGGPLFVRIRQNQYKQVGIQSWGVKCGGPPGVFTSVAKFMNWIDYVRNLKMGPTTYVVV